MQRTEFERREFIYNQLFISRVWKKWIIIPFIILLIGILFTSNTVSSQSAENSLNVIKEAYSAEKFSGTLKMEGTFPVEVFEIKIIFFKGTKKVDESIDKTVDSSWSYQTDVTTWALGEYDVRLIAHDNNQTVIGETSFKIDIESQVESGTMQGEIFEDEFIKKFKDKKFSDKLKMEKIVSDEVYSILVRILKDGETEVEKTSSNIKNSWSFETSVKDWDEGNYDILLTAKDQSNSTLDSTSIPIKVEEEEPFYMPLVCAIMLIIFIILIIVFFIISLLKKKKILANLKFGPKTVVKKLPMMSFVSMLLTLFFVISGLAVCMTANLDLIGFILFLTALGLLMLVTYWTFSNRNYPHFILYLIFAILSLIAVSLSALWSDADAFGLFIALWLISTALIIYFISIFIYWLTSRRGFLIALVTVILSLVFFILQIIFIVLAVFEFIDWWLTVVIGSVFLAILLFISWAVLRGDIFYFETRDESQTHRGWRRTLNMFDIISIPHGLLKRDHDRKVMGKISYEQTQDKKVRMEVIQIRDWESLSGRTQGRRLMGVYVSKMRGKEGPPFNKHRVAKSVKYTIYSSDTNLDDKLELSKAFGFVVQDSGKERGLDYYDLELVHRPFLGLGTPMGSDKKKDYDKDSGYARDSDKDKDREREHRYDYEHERERHRKEEERESKAAYERDRERERSRDRYSEPDEDLEDWDAADRGRHRERSHEHETRETRETKTEKPKKRPPPPKIVGDA